MSEQGGVLAVFKYLDHLTLAMEKIRGRDDFAGHEVFSPTSYHEIEDAGGFSASPVRWFTLAGALTGVTSGFALTLGTDWDWPITVGGKTAGIYSLPPDFIIGFELTILFGSLATILGMLIHCRIPNPKTRVLDPRLTSDRFAIFVPGASDVGAQAQFLRECGAQEIQMIADA